MAGLKAFEQCAGFMRIQDGSNPLDATGVHPESYEAAEKLLEKQGFTPEDIREHHLAGLSMTIRDYKKTADELGIGVMMRFGVPPEESFRRLHSFGLRNCQPKEKHLCRSLPVSGCCSISFIPPV